MTSTDGRPIVHTLGPCSALLPNDESLISWGNYDQ